MTDETIKPALAPEQWAQKHHFIQCYDSWDDEGAKSGVGEIVAGPGGYLTLSSKNGAEIGDFSAPADRHALAALCLYGQPFGFTIAMANACEFAATRCDRIVETDPDARGPALDAVTLRATAACIRALLPPP